MLPLAVVFDLGPMGLFPMDVLDGREGVGDVPLVGAAASSVERDSDNSAPVA